MRVAVLKSVAAALALGSVAACVSVDQSLDAIDTSNFELDPTHAFLTAKVTHFGISRYSIDLNGLSGQLLFDADAPTQSQVSIQIDARALETNYPAGEKKAEWEEELATSGRFMDADTFPTVTFVSTGIEQTSDKSGLVTGELNFRGVTRPVTLDVTFNGSATSPLDGGRRRVGFDAAGTFNRSDFGMGAMTQFVSDEVTVEFSGEFIEPAS